MEELIENKLTPFVTILPVTNGNTFPLNYRIGKVFLPIKTAVVLFVAPVIVLKTTG